MMVTWPWTNIMACPIPEDGHKKPQGKNIMSASATQGGRKELESRGKVSAIRDAENTRPENAGSRLTRAVRLVYRAICSISLVSMIFSKAIFSRYLSATFLPISLKLTSPLYVIHLSCLGSEQPRGSHALSHAPKILFMVALCNRETIYIFIL